MILTSTRKNLQVYGENPEPIAEFDDFEFETDDPVLINFLKTIEGVQEKIEDVVITMAEQEKIDEEIATKALQEKITKEFESFSINSERSTVK